MVVGLKISGGVGVICVGVRLYKSTKVPVKLHGKLADVLGVSHLNCHLDLIAVSCRMFFILPD